MEKLYRHYCELLKDPELSYAERLTYDFAKRRISELLIQQQERALQISEEEPFHDS